jgi:hypothetical protein
MSLLTITPARLAAAREIFIVLWIKAFPDQLIRVNPLPGAKHDVSY